MDFSGMGMTAFAFDDYPFDALGITHAWADDIWQAARDFIHCNHAPLPLYHDVEARPSLGPMLTFYVAGPPCQPWVRGGKQQGLVDPWAALFNSAIHIIRDNRPLAFFLEESDRIPAFQRGT